MLTSWLMATDPGGPAGDGRRAGGKSNLTAARQWNSKMAFFRVKCMRRWCQIACRQSPFPFRLETHTHTLQV